MGILHIGKFIFKCAKVKKCFRFFIIRIRWMIIFSYALWYVLENFLSLVFTLFAEAKFMGPFDRWNLGATEMSLYIIGIAIVTTTAFVWATLIVLAMIRFWKIKEGTILQPVIDGLKPNRFFILLYYFHFFCVWILVSVLMFIGQPSTTLVLWAIFLGF